MRASFRHRTTSLPNERNQGSLRLEPVIPEPALTEVASFAPSLSELPIDRGTIEHDLGYRKGDAPEPVSAAIGELLPQLASHAELQCGFRILPPDSVTIMPEWVDCGTATLAMGGVITKQLKSSSSLAIYVSTAGPGMELWSSQLMAEGELMHGFVVDTIASELVERASEWLEERIAESVKPIGWSLTNRYSPGYCDWPVSDQHNLFSLLPSGFCGISLTPSALMVPVKSLSGVIGVGKGVKRGAYQCSICEMKDCYRRREEPEQLEERG